MDSELHAPPSPHQMPKEEIQAAAVVRDHPARDGRPRAAHHGGIDSPAKSISRPRASLLSWRRERGGFIGGTCGFAARNIRSRVCASCWSAASAHLPHAAHKGSRSRWAAD